MDTSLSALWALIEAAATFIARMSHGEVLFYGCLIIGIVIAVEFVVEHMPGPDEP